MEFYVLYNIGVILEPMVRTELRHEAFPDGLFDLDFRLVGHQAWREIQIPFRDLMIPITYIKEATF